MSSTSKDKWLKFFLDAKIPKSSAEEYTLTFVENRIQSDMLLDLDKDYLNAMGITVMGDIIAILKHAKVCHVQNAKKNMLSKKPAGSSSNKPTPLSSDSNYRSVSMKKSQPAASDSVKSNVTVLKPVSKPMPMKTIESLETKVQSSMNKVKVPVASQVRSIVRHEKSVAISNGAKEVVKIENKPLLVRTPLVRKRPSTELSKPFVEKNLVEECMEDDHEIVSSESESDEPVDDITRKMAKKSIFDRLGNQGGSKCTAVESSERAVSSSTSPVTSSTVSMKKTPPPESTSSAGPKPGTLSYRMFPAHVHSTSSSDDLPDTALEDGDRILIEVDLNEAKPLTTGRAEFTVALPPDYQSSSKSTSVFDRLGGKRSQFSATSSNPGKSILKMSASSLRITKPSSPLNLLPNKRDFKSISTLNTKLSLIRSQVTTEGVLGKPENSQEKVPAKDRIGTSRNQLVTSRGSNRNQPVTSRGTNRNQPATPTSSVKSRLTLSQNSEKKLDVLAKRTLSSTPAHVKARIESEQQKYLSKAKCGSGIKARLGFKTRGEKELDERRTKSLSPTTMSSQVFEREILTNGEEEAEMTLDGKKRVRFHCVEKKLIPHRHEDKILQKRFSSPLPYSRDRARVW